MADGRVRHFEEAQGPARSPAGTLDRSVRLSVSGTFEAERVVDLRDEWRVREREPRRSSG